MALWHITRVATPTAGAVTVDCADPTTPMQVDLKDSATGNTASVQMCWDPRAGHVCDNLDLLGVTYTPNDWGDDCP